MADDTIQTASEEIAGTYDDNPNVTEPIGDSQSPPVDDMPWLLRDKFKGETLEDVMKQQAMAYTELQTKMGKFWGAPKDTDYDVASLSEYGIDSSDPILNSMKNTFKEMGLSNEAVKKLAAGYNDGLQNMARSLEENLQKSMTPDLAAQAKRVDGWLSKFSKPEQDTFKGWLQTPEDFRAFNTLIALNPNGLGQGNAIPAQGASYGFKYESAKSVESEKVQNFARYNKDPVYRDELSRRYRDALIREKNG